MNKIIKKIKDGLRGLNCKITNINYDNNELILTVNLPKTEIQLKLAKIFKISKDIKKQLLKQKSIFGWRIQEYCDFIFFKKNKKCIASEYPCDYQPSNIDDAIIPMSYIRADEENGYAYGPSVGHIKVTENFDFKKFKELLRKRLTRNKR